jgi:hypothetical protein
LPRRRRPAGVSSRQREFYLLGRAVLANVCPTLTPKEDGNTRSLDVAAITTGFRLREYYRNMEAAGAGRGKGTLRSLELSLVKAYLPDENFLALIFGAVIALGGGFVNPRYSFVPPFS